MTPPMLASARSVRSGARYPKFADKFAMLDFAAEPMPAISLYPVPEPVALHELSLTLVGLDCAPTTRAWTCFDGLPRYTQRQPLICQIFNWVEVMEWTGVRLADVLAMTGIATHAEGYVGVFSRDGSYFEGLSMPQALDPRVLLATGMNGRPMPLRYGGPLRLVVPFLQGYKSVKWVGSVRAFRHDPVGIKRLLAQSKTARLAPPWRQRFGIEPPDGYASDPVSDPESDSPSVADVELAVAEADNP
jgi:DMSO/TMAO reductase YedYZ molybdopterin-dependent catalytic subunit